MISLSEKKLSDCFYCPYIPEKTGRYQYFFAADVNPEELQKLLDNGWRKFGIYFFRPACPDCRKCLTVRVIANEYIPSDAQKRIVKKNNNTCFKVNDLTFSDEIFNLYTEFNRDRFNDSLDRKNFLETFYQPATVSLQSEYFIDDSLTGVGWLDRADSGFSSIYFCYNPAYKKISPGIFSIIKEIEFTRTSGLRYYYLGYAIDENSHLAYKKNFFPYEYLNWENGDWIRIEQRGIK